MLPLHINYRPQQEEFSSASNQPSQWEVPTSLTLLFPQWTFFKLTHPNCLLLLYKVTFLSFVGLAYDFCYSFLAPNCNFSTILEKRKQKLFFCQQYNWLFIFRFDKGNKTKILQLKKKPLITENFIIGENWKLKYQSIDTLVK